MTIGEKLKLLRKRHKMTLEDVAEHLSVGRATVLRYENGMITNIPSDKIEILARLFGVSPSYLMGWDEKKDSDFDESENNPDIRILVRDLSKLSPDQLKQARSVFRAMFKITNPELFEEGEDDK